MHYRNRYALFALFLLLTPSLSVTACGDLPPIQYPEVIKCGPPVEQLIGTVTRILFSNSSRDADSASAAEELRMSSTISERAVAELDNLARAHGADAVACLVEEVLDEWKQTASSATPDRLRSIERGRDFLRLKGTREVDTYSW